jgi:hypothetical protein
MDLQNQASCEVRFFSLLADVVVGNALRPLHL